MSIDPLTSSKIDSSETERKSQELINEWLKSYFNGDTHEVAGVERDFPDLTQAVFFNQTQLPNPLGSAIIHWLFADLRSVERMEGQTKKLVTVDFLSTVYIRASASGEGNTADFQCRAVADLLRALVLSPERHRLNQAGIHHLRTPRGPVPVSIPGFQSRMMVITGQLQYRIEWES